MKFSRILILLSGFIFTSPVYCRLAVAKESQSITSYTVTNLNQALALDPQDAETYYNRGNLHYEQGKPESAIADFSKAIQIDPKHILSYTYRGFIYLEQENYDLAEADYNQVIRLSPYYAKGYLNRADFYFRIAEYHLAWSDWERAKKLYVFQDDATGVEEVDEILKTFAEIKTPNSVIAYQRRGMLYASHKKYDLAEADYTKAIQIDPENAVVYHLRGALYKEQAKYELARTDWEKSRSLYLAEGNTTQAQKIADFLKTLESNLRQDGQNDSVDFLSEANLDRDIQANSEDAVAYFEQGNVYYQQKKYELAEESFHKNQFN